MTAVRQMKRDKKETTYTIRKCNIGTLTEYIRREQGLCQFFQQQDDGSMERMALLWEILGEWKSVQLRREKMEHFSSERLTCKIYLYGSMIKEQDLLARQIFLWLLSLLRETER